MLERTYPNPKEVYLTQLPYLQHFLSFQEVDKLMDGKKRQEAGEKWFCELGIYQAKFFNDMQFIKPDSTGEVVGQMETLQAFLERKFFFKPYNKGLHETIVQSLLLLGYEGDGETVNYFIPDIVAVGRALGWIAIDSEPEVSIILGEGAELKHRLLDYHPAHRIPEIFFKNGRRHLIKKDGSIIENSEIARRFNEELNYYTEVTKFGSVPHILNTPSGLLRLCGLTFFGDVPSNPDDIPQAFERIANTLHKESL